MFEAVGCVLGSYIVHCIYNTDTECSDPSHEPNLKTKTMFKEWQILNVKNIRPRNYESQGKPK